MVSGGKESCANVHFCLNESSRALLVVFLKFPSCCAKENRIGESSYHRTPFRLIYLTLAAIERHPNRSLSAPTVSSLSLTSLTWTFLYVTSKVFTLSFGIGSQKLIWLVFNRFSTNVFIWLCPVSVPLKTISNVGE